MQKGYKHIIERKLKKICSLSNKELCEGINQLGNKYNVDVSFLENNVIKDIFRTTGPI